MYNKRNKLITFALLSVVLIGVTFVSASPAAAVNTQGAPGVEGNFKGQLPNGVWYNVENVTSNFPLQNATGTDVQYHLFSFGNQLYAIKENNNWGLNITVKFWFYRVTLVSNPDGSGRPIRLRS